MVESLVLRLRRLRAAAKRLIDRLMGTDTGAEVVPAHEPVFEQVKGKMVNAVLLATMLTAIIYAPHATYPTVSWLLASICAGVLAERGVEWQRFYYDAMWTGRPA